MQLTREIRDGRIALCKDVIDRIEHHDLCIASAAGYLTEKPGASPRAVAAIIKKGHRAGKDAQGIVDQLEPFCQACIRGAMMLSKARVFNDMPMGDIVDSRSGIDAERGDTRVALEDFFDAEDLAQIEAAFEVYILDIEDVESEGVCDYDWGKLRGACCFGKFAEGDQPGRLGAKARCLAVMQNIAANDGVFTFDPVAISLDPLKKTCERRNYRYPDFQGM